MKTTKSFVIGLSFIIIMVTASVMYIKENPKMMGDYYTINYVVYEDLKGLEGASDLIVIASSDKEIKDKKQQEKGGYAWVQDKITIKEVLKGDESLKEIELKEYASKEFGRIYLIDDYVPLEKDEEYILFLNKDDNDTYSIVNVNNGRYKISGEEKIEKRHHEEIREEIQEKYNIGK